MSIHLITLICQLTDGLCKEAEADAASVQFAERGGVAGWKRSAAPECAASSKVCHSVLSADGDGDDANLPPRTEEAKRKKNFTNPHYTITHKSEVLKVKKWSEVKWGGVMQHKNWVAVDSVNKKISKLKSTELKLWLRLNVIMQGLRRQQQHQYQKERRVSRKLEVE